MDSTPGFAEPRPDWWEASALTTAPSLAPHFWHKIAKFANFSTEQVCELKFFTLERFSVNTTGHVRKMRQFKSKQINFWVLKFFCHSFQMIYITSCAIVLHVFSINSVQMCRHFGLLDHIPTTNHRYPGAWGTFVAFFVFWSTTRESTLFLSGIIFDIFIKVDWLWNTITLLCYMTHCFC